MNLAKLSLQMKSVQNDSLGSIHPYIVSFIIWNAYNFFDSRLEASQGKKTLDRYNWEESKKYGNAS